MNILLELSLQPLECLNSSLMLFLLSPKGSIDGYEAIFALHKFEVTTSRLATSKCYGYLGNFETRF